jgi:hypothetical protein
MIVTSGLGSVGFPVVMGADAALPMLQAANKNERAARQKNNKVKGDLRRPAIWSVG